MSSNTTKPRTFDAMAQESYLSTYRTYKAGTKRLTTWLVQAARVCGVDSTSFATDKWQDARRGGL